MFNNHTWRPILMCSKELKRTVFHSLPSKVYWVPGAVGKESLKMPCSHGKSLVLLLKTVTVTLPGRL